MTESKQDLAVLREEAHRNYVEAIRDFHASLLLAANKNEAVIEAFNACCLAGVSVVAFHWDDLHANPLSNSRLIQWAQGVAHNLNVTL